MNIRFWEKENEELRLKFFTHRSTLIQALLDRLAEENEHEFSRLSPSREITRKTLSLGEYRSSAAIHSLSGYKRSTLIAMYRALSHPSYSVLTIMAPLVSITEQEVRESAAYFDILETAGVDYRAHNAILDALHSSGDSFKRDISSLKCKRRAHAEAVLRLIIHFYKAGRLTNNGCPKPVVDMLGKDPELLNRLLSFADARKPFLSELDAGLFQSTLLLEAPALSEGML